MRNTKRPELAGLTAKEYRDAYYRLRREEQREHGIVCSRCGVLKSVDDFSSRNPQCKPCRSAIEAERYEHNKEQMRNRARERKFGLTPGQYQAMLDEQGGMCAICKQPETNTLNGVVRALSVDHDHGTDEIRGLLCGKCNTRLHDGVAIEWYARAAAYLHRH